MLIQVNTDHNIEGSEGLEAHVTDLLNDQLGRFDEHLTRLEVHFKDINGASKDVGDDIQCSLEARFKGMDPFAVTHEAPDVHKAARGASDKMKTHLQKVVDRLKSH